MAVKICHATDTGENWLQGTYDMITVADAAALMPPQLLWCSALVLPGQRRAKATQELPGSPHPYKRIIRTSVESSFLGHTRTSKVFRNVKYISYDVRVLVKDETQEAMHYVRWWFIRLCNKAAYRKAVYRLTWAAKNMSESAQVVGTNSQSQRPPRCGRHKLPVSTGRNKKHASEKRWSDSLEDLDFNN